MQTYASRKMWAMSICRFYFHGWRQTPVTLQIMNAAKPATPRQDGYRMHQHRSQTWTRRTRHLRKGAHHQTHPRRPNAMVRLLCTAYARTAWTCSPTASYPTTSPSIARRTVDGRDLHRLTIGEGPLQFWVIGRQHPEKAWHRGGWKLWPDCSILMTPFRDIF